MPVGECYAPGGSSLAQQRSAKSEEDDTEKEPVLPTCNGKNGVKKVDCVVRNPLKVCKGNKAPKLKAGEEA